MLIRHARHDLKMLQKQLEASRVRVWRGSRKYHVSEPNLAHQVSHVTTGTDCFRTVGGYSTLDWLGRGQCQYGARLQT